MSIPFNFGENPGQVCQIVSQDTYATNDVALSGLGGGGGGYDPDPAFSTVVTSSITVSSILTSVIYSEDSIVAANTLNMKVNGGPTNNSLCLEGRLSTIVSIDGPTYKFAIFERTGGTIIVTNDGTFNANGLIVNSAGIITMPAISAISTLNFNTTQGVMTNISSINGVSWARISTVAGGP